MPGNRLKLRSVPANRLKPGVLGRQFTGPLTGAQIDERSLGQVPSAVHADAADSAQTAIDAQTALNAVNAVDAPDRQRPRRRLPARHPAPSPAPAGRPRRAKRR